ncbi:hypothetical protein EV356DRAFT_512289 [Viridothelium virens]|uniref:Uncharacterized protein n=1 Tax=Viridothelium virens TaxID=1048519 RepID=A0A6A6HFW8_VIRVR|nr:hypothetical protein EV356DRAFT_512289 [Viridothelium virens]
MAEADDVVFVDCRCGRHPTFEESKPKAEEPIRPIPPVKPKRFCRRVPDDLAPQEEREDCKCRNSKDTLNILLGSSPYMADNFSRNGRANVPEEKSEIHNSNNHILPEPVMLPKPHGLPVAPAPPMEGPAPFPSSLPYRVNPDRRAQSPSVDSYDSSSDESVIPPRRRGRGAGRGSKPFPFVEISSHHEMMNHLVAPIPNYRGGVLSPEMASCSAMLIPFGRRAYVNSMSFSVVDLKKYFWLLKLAEPEAWYPWPSKQTLAQMTALGNAGLSATVYDGLQPISAYQPKALSVPRVCLGQPLLETAVSKIGCICIGGSKNGDHCYACDRIRKTNPKNLDLQFYSVQQSEEVLPIYNRLQDPRDVESHTLPIYRVVVTGSLDAAAAQAFCDAGANGWSTLFTCAIAENNGEKLGEIKSVDALERVDQPWKLTGNTLGAMNDKIKVFY